jgi:Leucine-rich repeat (LRR) protein
VLPESRTKARSNNEVNVFYAYNPDVLYIPKSIGEFFPNLRFLRITKSALRYTEYRDYKNLKHLHTLDLSWNKIERVSQCAFHYLESLVKINLSGNQIQALHEKTFMNLPLLEEFFANSNKIAHLDEEIFQSNLQLREIEMRDNKLEVIEINFQKMTSIKVVDFRDNDCIDMKYVCCQIMYLLSNITSGCKGPETC